MMQIISGRLGAKLWNLLSKACGEKVTKSTFRSVLRQRSNSLRLLLAHSLSLGESPPQVSVTASDTADINISAQNPDPELRASNLGDAGGATTKAHQDWSEAIDVSVF